MPDTVPIDAASRRRANVTLPGYLTGRAPHNKGMSYPADPPRVEEIIAVMRQAGDDRHGLRVRAVIAVLWRGGLRISEALALSETDVDPRRGSLLIRHGKGDRRREVGMDDWGFEHLTRWREHRVELPVGPLFCIIDGPTRGRAWPATAVRGELRELAAQAGVRRRLAPHQLRHAHAVELAREGVPVNIIQRQLGHYAGDPVKWRRSGFQDGGRLSLAASVNAMHRRRAGFGVCLGPGRSKSGRATCRVGWRGLLDPGCRRAGCARVRALDVIGELPDTSLACGRARAWRVRRLVGSVCRSSGGVKAG
ncbi:MAG: tyrosine-type recombinase/integrase [Solirubrobacteraceae bacterium]